MWANGCISNDLMNISCVQSPKISDEWSHWQDWFLHWSSFVSSLLMRSSITRVTRTHTHTSKETNKLTNTRPSLESPQRCAAKIVVVCALTHYKPIADAKSALANGPSGSKWRCWSSVADPISWHGTIFVFYSVCVFGSPNDLKKQGWHNIPQP